MIFSTVSPCKLNLFLYITGKRPDGYHNLQTLFVILDHGDPMTFEVTDSKEISITPDFGVPPEDNLIYKAACALRKQAGLTLGARISISKVLPMGGGLGGGSGNAATTLLVLNKLWNLNYSCDQLIEIAAKLGADVPIFIMGTTCFAEGIGEILTPVEYPDYFYLVSTPSCKVPTGKLFSSPMLKRDSPSRSLSELIVLPFENSFTTVVIREYPDVEKLLALMRDLAGNAYMSGSGSSCFSRFNTKEEALVAQSRLLEHKVSSFIAASMKESRVISDLKKL